MKIEMAYCLETPKGVVVSLELDDDGRQYLLELGFNAMLRKTLDMVETENEREED
jgi:hypothetical protein